VIPHILASSLPLWLALTIAVVLYLLPQRVMLLLHQLRLLLRRLNLLLRRLNPLHHRQRERNVPSRKYGI
jgi:hypothetical protein